VIATTELRRLKIELERRERPAKQEALENKIQAATAHIRPPENRIRGAAVKVRGKYRENPVKKVIR
jgi:hypothetical protein